MRIGIIGAENSHTAAIAKVINVEKRVRGFSVDYVWGEKPRFAKDTAEKGRIPNIVKRPVDMLDLIDAVIVDHRHAKYHLPAVLPFVKEGVPTFVDKPFCYRSAEGRQFLRVARRKGTPVTSFGVVPLQASFRRFRKKLGGIGEIMAGATYGPCDLKSKWGGVFFYGVHQVEMALAAFGSDVASVAAVRNGDNAAAQLLYPSGAIVTLNLIKEGCPGFRIAAVGDGGTVDSAIPFDKSPYLAGVRTFTRMFRTGEEPIPHDEILKPVQVLEALEKSLVSGKTEKVAG